MAPLNNLNKKIKDHTVLMLFQKLLQITLCKTGDAMISFSESLPFLLGKSVLNKEQKMIINENAPFKNSHNGKRCFVIGSGISLSTQDISPLKNEITFGMNSFWRHPILDQWQPTYYCFADPIFFDGSQIMLDFHKSLEKKIQTSTFFLPLTSKRSIEEQGILINAKKYYLAFGGKLSNGKAKEIDLCGILPSVQSVSQLCIMIAMDMGCSPIYLLGLDHDWLSHQGLDKHFYKGKTGFENHPQVHTDLGKNKYVQEVESVHTLWKGYETIEKIAKINNIEIINVTNGGFLDVFRREKYEDVI